MQDVEGVGLDIAMAQHLLVAADRFALARLRRICERRLCDTVEVCTSLQSPVHYRHTVEDFINMVVSMRFCKCAEQDVSPVETFVRILTSQVERDAASSPVLRPWWLSCLWLDTCSI